MKKGIVIVLAVAIIGALGVYGKSHGDAGNGSSTSPSTIANSGASTTLGSSTTGAASSNTSYKDGTYTGNGEDTPYGMVQIAVVVSGGKITNVNFLRLPSDLGHSQEVSSFSAPLLKQETLQKQNAHIDFVSGATQTSQGYRQSLQSALDQAA
jgi:uncharacterized protein with FMN-binding domain